VESVHGKDDPKVGSILQKMGMLQFRSGSLVGAKSSLEKVVRIYRKAGKEYEPHVLKPLFILGNIYNILRQKDEAHSVWEDAYQRSIAIGDEADQDMHDALSRLVNAH